MQRTNQHDDFRFLCRRNPLAQEANSVDGGVPIRTPSRADAPLTEHTAGGDDDARGIDETEDQEHPNDNYVDDDDDSRPAARLVNNQLEMQMLSLR